MANPKLTGEHFYKFFQCPHWIWYDIYGDAVQKKEMPPLLDLIYKGKMHDADVKLRNHKRFDEIKPELFRDLEEAFIATLELMKQGKNIYHGVLMHNEWVGMPDLMEARSGKSQLGDHYYVVYDAQNSLDLRDEFKFPLVFYSLILEQLQGIRPHEAYAIDPQGNERSFVVNDFVEQFHVTREQIEKILDGEKPAPFLKAGCRRSPWYSICLSETQGCNDVSLVYKLSQADQRRLYGIGIKTVIDLADANLDDLRVKLEDWSFDKLIRFNNQAKVLMTGTPVVTRKPEFPVVKTEVYLDIESDPLRDIDYLLGVLTRDVATGTSVYRPFLARGKDGERRMWQEFLDFLTGLDDFVVYHYAYYERQVFDRLMVRYGAPTALATKFRENTIDLHLKTVDSVVLPLYFYTLKDVARFFGFSWHDPKAGGAESVVWYDEWVRTGDETVMQRILQYNEDDVRATLLVRDQLATFKPVKTKETLEEPLP
jgi:uncharacterized protein